MAKFSPKSKLDKEKRQQVLLELCYAFSLVTKLEDVARLLGDLLSDSEIEMIAKRLQIAKLLLNGGKYEDVGKKLKTSPTTIARVNLWLQQAEEGFRMVMKRGLVKEDMEIPSWQPSSHFGAVPDSWAALKRKYPMYFWPQLLLEEIARSANNRQRRRMIEVLQILRESGKGKRQVFRDLERIFSAERVAANKKLSKPR